ncbi:hypothetical protein Q0F99_13720 [Rathayibacter oskolensis]|uniref:hypothetical protein n=1 Tax=Rathayibacter oskolensis TaxID=1891671 RepID=UPI0026604A29|nr:hypothetical protein [Rathayibacter oskolensis]WKK70814.1 hypothetical protein Q0F99_13720 [Rathayibacter oskolensis]
MTGENQVRSARHEVVEDALVRGVGDADADLGRLVLRGPELVDGARDDVDPVESDVRVVDAEELDPGAADREALGPVVQIRPAEGVGEEAGQRLRVEIGLVRLRIPRGPRK